MKDIFKEKKILVTGGTGSIGSEIVKQLLRFDINKIVVYSIDEIEQYIMSQSLRDSRLEFILGDVRDYRHLDSVFSQSDFDFVYHAAALKHVVMCERSPIEPVKTNIEGTQNVIDLSVDHGVKKLLFISTDKAVYPTNVMGATKFIAERLVLNASRYAKEGQAFSCIRFGNVANSRGSVIPVFVSNLLDNKPIIVTDRRITRFTMNLDDAVNLILKATVLMKGGEIFIMKMKAFNLGDLVEALQRVWKKTSGGKIRVQEMGLTLGEKLHEELVSGLEIDDMYEMDELYVVMPHPSDPRQVGLRKAEVASYRSDGVELISTEELGDIILECMKSKDLLRPFSSPDT